MDLFCLSQTEQRDPGGANVLADPPQVKASDPLVHSDQKEAEVVKYCTEGASSGSEPEEVVEVRLCRISVNT